LDERYSCFHLPQIHGVKIKIFAKKELVSIFLAWIILDPVRDKILASFGKDLLG